MKTVYWLTFLLLLHLSSEAQIDSFEGVIDLRTCNFESASNLISLDTSFENIWQIGKPAKAFFDTAFSPPNALMTDSIHPYATSNHSYFDFKFATYFPSILVSFRHKFQTDTLTDGGYVEISYDKGATWTNMLYADTAVSSVFYATENLYSQKDTLKGGINGFSGTSNGWILTRIEWVWMWLEKKYPADSIFMRFHFISDSLQTNKAGWMIDNITLSKVRLPGAIKETNLTDSKIQVYPNPAKKIVTVKFENVNKEPVSFTVINPYGQTVMEVENVRSDEVQFDTANMYSGMYYIQLKTSNKLLGVRKLIVE